MDTNSRPSLLDIVERIVGDIEADKQMSKEETLQCATDIVAEVAMTVAAQIDGFFADVQSITASQRILAEAAFKANTLTAMAMSGSR